LVFFHTHTQVAVQNEVQYQTRSNRICPKKEIIFDKLDMLLKKLGAETFNRKQTDAAAQANADATLKAWLDAESEYRIQEEKVKEAEEGSKFARERYKKYSEIVKQTQERLDTMKPSYNKELEDIAEEKALLQEILRMFGILGDQPLTDTAKNAGGYMSGSATKAMPQQLHLKKDQLALQAKLAELQKDAQNGGPISLQQIALLQTKLANFQESDEVKQMLIDMLKDLEDRADALNDSLERTETELAGHKKKLYDYETSVVDLSNAADKARMKKSSMNLEREKLAGDKTNAGEAYKTEHAEFNVVEPPAGKNAICHSSSCHLLLSHGVLTLSYFVLTRCVHWADVHKFSQTALRTFSRSSWPRSMSSALASKPKLC
jgi:hypothetical protein